MAAITNIDRHSRDGARLAAYEARYEWRDSLEEAEALGEGSLGHDMVMTVADRWRRRYQAARSRLAGATPERRRIPTAARRLAR